MRDIGRKLTVVNTGPRKNKSELTDTPQMGRGNSSSAVSALPKPGYIIDLVSPVIAENYADSIMQLSTESYLYNPSFANEAEGWNISEEHVKDGKVKIVVSDFKVRIKIRDGGSVSQANGRIKKPGTHEEYLYDENEASAGYTTSEGWPVIIAPEIKEGKNEKTNILYLSVSFVCNESGIISVGFPSSDNSIEGVLEYVTRSISKSEEVQTISSQGTWDKEGIFTINVPAGEVEIISVSLTGSPLESYRKQTESAINQSLQNFKRAFDFFPLLKEWTDTAQNEIQKLKSKNTTLSETIEAMSQNIAKLEERIDKLEKAVNPSE
jgi:hypothetical protein